MARAWGGGAGVDVCGEHGVDAGEENKIAGCFLFWCCVAASYLPQPSEQRDFATAAWETDRALRSEATCISPLRWPLCSMEGL